MNLNEAIEHSYEVAQKNKICNIKAFLRHIELAHWLEELKSFREGKDNVTIGTPIPYEIIQSCYKKANSTCSMCGEQHRQIARWLEELNSFREKVLK